MAAAPLTAGSTPSSETAALPPGVSAFTPEGFGATGDGVADDAIAIQRTLDAAAASRTGGTVVLQPRVAYRCGTGLTLDATRVSLWGRALLDFPGWAGACLRVSATSSAKAFTPANNYGPKGVIGGAIRIRGAGADSRSVGVELDSPNAATSAQILAENLAVSDCGVGVRFGARAYDSVFLHCEVFDCGVCVEYPAAEDNGERNTLIGCMLFNSYLAVRMGQSSGALHLQSCSLDYTRQLYDVTGGSVLATSCHHESDRWSDPPIRCVGDGAAIRLNGGALLSRAGAWTAQHVADVGNGAMVGARDLLAHNLALAAPDPTRLPAWATGAGTFTMTGTGGFDLGLLPPRLHAQRSRVSDPDFGSSIWEDPVWRLRDATLPITTRQGGEGDNLRLSKGVFDDESALHAAKAYGTTSAASFALIALAVAPGEQVLAGFRVRRDPRRPGANGTLFISPTWARIDGQDQNRMPVVVRSEDVGTLTTIPPTDRFVPVSPLNARAQRLAPLWATHFLMVVDLVGAHQASFLFNGLWADTI